LLKFADSGTTITTLEDEEQDEPALASEKQNNRELVKIEINMF
jgi:hypothetical protein